MPAGTTLLEPRIRTPDRYRGADFNQCRGEQGLSLGILRLRTARQTTEMVLTVLLQWLLRSISERRDCNSTIGLERFAVVSCNSRLAGRYRGLPRPCWRRFIFHPQPFPLI